MKPKKLSNTFRNSEHGEKAEPLVAGGQEIKMKGLLEEQESYYLQSSHLFKLDGADLEKPEAPFRASKQVMEKLQKDQATQNWFADRPGFGGDPDNTPIPEWYQELMGLLGPWMAGGGQMTFFHSNAGYSAEDHTMESGDWHGFHSEMWRIQREAREFVIQQLFDFDQDGVSLGMDPEVQDYIYNYLIDQNPANSWITPDMITPYNLHGLGHWYSQTNPQYTGDLELRWLGPDGQQVLGSSGGVLGPTGWLNQWMNNGPGAEYALANEWQWPPSIDPFGLWQSMAEGAPMPPDPLNAMFAGSQFLVQMVTYQDGTSNPEEFPEIDFDIDYEAEGYESLLDYYVSTSSLYAQNPIMLYYQYMAGGGDAYSHLSGAAFFYPHYLQQLLQTLGIDIDPSINTDYSGYATGNIDDFFTGPGMEEYQALLDLMSLHHEQYPGDTDSGMASMLQAYMSSNGEYGWNAQLGAYMDWYATGVQGGFIELSEAGYDTFEAAYTAYTGDPDNPFNWFWFDFSEEIGSDNFLNIYEYTLSPDGYSPDWGQTFGSDSGYNEGGSYGNSTYDFDPQADINFVTDAAGYLDNIPMPGVFGGEGVPEWYTFITHTMNEWNQNYSNFGITNANPDGTIFNHYDYPFDFLSFTLETIFNYDGDNNITGTEMQYLADLGYPVGQLMIDYWDGLLPEGVTTGLTINDITPELLAISWNSQYGMNYYNLLEAVPAFEEYGITNVGMNSTNGLSGWMGHWVQGGYTNQVDEFGTGNSILGSTWHADFFNGSAYAMANGGNGMPDALDPLGIWQYNTFGEGAASGWSTGGTTTGIEGYNANQGAISLFTYWGNQSMMDDQDGSLFSGNNLFAPGSSFGWANQGVGGGYAFLNAINYLTGYLSSNGTTGAGYDGNDEYPSIWSPLYDYLEGFGYEYTETGVLSEYLENNPELIELYQDEDPQSWQYLSSAFNIISQYLTLAPVNPLMPEANFMQDQIDMMDWYLQGVVGYGSEDDPDTWNGPLFSELSDVAIQNVVTAIETGSFWFDFTYGITDDNFLFSTNLNPDQFYGNDFAIYSGQPGSWDEAFTFNVDPTVGMSNLLGAEAAVDIQAFVQAHGGMIDYNGDGRVDVGDILGLISFHMSPQAYEAGMGFDMSVFAAGGFNPFQTQGLAYFFQNNAALSNIAPNGSMNWMLQQQPSFDSFVFEPTNILGGSFTGSQGLGSSFITILSTLVVFQFVNDFIDNGAVPEWYSSILDGELSASTSTFNDFLSAVYPEWTVWSSQNFNITFEDSTEYNSIYDELVALLPPQEALVNYATYYVSEGIDINQEFVVSYGNTINISSGGESLVDGLWEDLSSYSSQDFVVNVVSNNAEFFASFDVNQDGDYGFEDNVAVTLIVALLMEYLAVTDQGGFEQLNIAEILFDLAENHATYTVMPYGILDNINAAGQFGDSTNVREALNYLLNVAGFDGFISTDPDAPSAATSEQVVDALLGMVTSVISSLYTTVGSGVTEVSPGVLSLGSLESQLGTILSSFIEAAFVTFIENGDNNAILQTLFENTDGSYYVDADGNEIPFSFTAAGLQALAGATYGAQAGSGASLYQTAEWNEAYQDIAQALGEAGLDIDFNGDGVYDMNDINILLSIAENGPVTEAQVQLAEILNYQSGTNSVEFGLDDVIMFMNFFGNPGPTTVYGYDGSAYSWIDSDGDQTVYGMDGTNINMFGYFNDDGTWVDFGYDDLTPDDYFGPGWSATQTNNNETTS